MAKSARKPESEININLLPTKGGGGTVSEAIGWVLNVGRYLIIITEVIALAIFILSIILTAEKNSLTEDIEILSGEVEQQQAFEQEFRNIQEQISEVRQLNSSRFETNAVLDEFLKLLPEGVTVENFELSEDQLEFGGFFTSASQLQTMVLSFTSSDKLVGLNLSKLTSPTDTNPNYTFSALISINRVGFR